MLTYKITATWDANEPEHPRGYFHCANARDAQRYANRSMRGLLPFASITLVAVASIDDDTPIGSVVVGR